MTETAPVEVGGLDWHSSLPASAAIQAGELLFVAGQLAIGADGRPLAPGDVRAQTSEALDRVQALVETAGGGMKDVVDVMSFHSDVRRIDEALEVAAGYFGAGAPAWTAVGMTGTYAPGLDVSIRAIAHLGKGARRSAWASSPGREPPLAIPAACGKGSYVFVSGLPATTGTAASAGGHAAQARGAYGAVRAALEEAGASMDDVLDICSFHLDPRGMVPCEGVHMETWRETPIPQAPA